MIISDKNEYLFLATPRTGSTAISSELCTNYSGRSILDKHSNYHEFLRVASDKQKQYFVFAGVRNPLDDAVSMYEKFRTNHKGSYTNPSEWIEKGGWVTKRMRKVFHFVQNPRTGFKDFLKQYYRTPYTSRININEPHCDFVIRFESIQDGFSQALERIGLNKVRDLPVVNPTNKEKTYIEYYQGKDTKTHAARVFAPFMFEWNYGFPSPDFYEYISRMNFAIYEVEKEVRYVYSEMAALGLLKVIDTIPI